jgi:hypothetical protein
VPDSSIASLTNDWRIGKHLPRGSPIERSAGEINMPELTCFRFLSMSKTFSQLEIFELAIRSISAKAVRWNSELECPHASKRERCWPLTQ